LRDAFVLVIRGTKTVLDRVGGVSATDADRWTTSLGDWYVNVLFWRPRVALFVSEATLLPVLVPFAPAATLLDRFPSGLLAHLRAHEIGPSFTEPELAEMDPRRLAKTASRIVLGVMNEFKYLADIYAKVDGEPDLLAVSLRLAETPRTALPTAHQPRSRAGRPGRIDPGLSRGTTADRPISAACNRVTHCPRTQARRHTRPAR
jgi:hypothetical protein